MQETARIRQHVEAAIAKGFFTFALLPKKKEPHPKYSPSGFKSAGRSAVALSAWTDGVPANYGVACGASNLCVVDCDYGLADYDAFIKWRDEHNIPETYTVRTGRRTSYGVQMYFANAIHDTKFSIGDVTGELKSLGGYVVGEGSVHPDSGEQYEVVIDAPIADLPEGIAALGQEKQKINFVSKKDGGDLIPAGNRWVHCQSMAGKFRNAGLDEEGIYDALRNFLKNNCEDGEDYPDDKIRLLANAAITKFDATEVAPVLFMEEDNKDDDKALAVPPVILDSVLKGDWIGEMTRLLTKGTAVPPQFVRANLKTIIGASLDGKVGFPGEEKLHTRQWTILISRRPQTGKGESWKRVREYSGMQDYVKAAGIVEPPSGYVSSGEHLVKILAPHDGQNCVFNFDEMTKFFTKAKEGSTLLHVVTELFEQKTGAAGSNMNTAVEFKNIGFNFTGGFTESSFDTTLAGKNLGGDGFLSRVTIEHSDVIDHKGMWSPIPGDKVAAVVKKMCDRYHEISNLLNEKFPTFVPEITDEAMSALAEFDKWYSKEIEVETVSGGMSFTPRINSHMKRDILLRTIMSDDYKTITADHVRRSFEWAKRQLEMRRILYPIDKGNFVERFEQLIQTALTKTPVMSKAKIMRACNVFRAGCGGVSAFNIAWKSLLQGNVLTIVGTTSKRTEKFAIHEDFKK